MSKRGKRKENKEDKIKFYEIKIPVFTTRVLDERHGLFPDISKQDMVDLLIRKIKAFNVIQTGNRKKAFINVIESVQYEEVKIGDTPSLLLRISSYKTNMSGGYFQTDKKIQISKESRLGDDNNFVLLYPKISGISEKTYSCYFLMLAYEDPNKETGTVSKIAKEVAKKVLDFPVQNIKMPLVLQELKRIGIIPELSVTYFAIENSDKDVGEAYRKYIIKSCLKSEKKRNFKDMPFDTVNNLLNDKEEDGNYDKKETILSCGKTEYRIEKILAEAAEELKETAEKIFNASVSITPKEVEEDIYKKDFILSKMCSVITNYESVE